MTIRTNVAPQTPGEEMQLIRPEDVVIPVMGMTGAGKSTFISLCTQEPEISIGHGLTSFTSKISIHTMDWEGRTIHLVDTPGFDDTGRSDTETFQEVAFWLTVAHDHGIHISGVIYLHRITNLRIQGAALQSLEVVKKICGAENYNAIVLGTTRWDEVLPNQRGKAKARQRELCQKDWFWGDIVQAGGKVVSLDNPREDALDILGHIVNKKQKLTLAFQHQIFEEHRQVFQTDAGRVLYEAANEQLEAEGVRLEEAKKSIREEVVRYSRTRDTRELAELRTQLETAMESRKRDISELQEGVDTLQMKWLAKMESEIARERQELVNLLASPCRDSRSDIISVATPRSADAEMDTLSMSRAQQVRMSVPALVDDDGRERPSRKLTALTVMGTALGAGQLIAAMACTIL